MQNNPAQFGSEINRSAVLHIPLSQYAYAVSETTITLRLRAAKGNLKSCTLHYGDRAWMSDPIPFFSAPMEKLCSDLYFDYYEISLTAGFNRICYCFELYSEEERMFYCADLFLIERPKERSEYYQYPIIRREELSDVPAWFKRAVVYNIFPDSFATGKRFLSGQTNKLENGTPTPSQSRHGGTLRGIIENLDYIKSMGFTCIYLNPIFLAGEYHKYDTLDYMHIDPCFGTDEDFGEFMEKAHTLGLAVILDGVFNHCSWYFFAFDDVVKNGSESRYADWFYDLSFPVIRPEGEGEFPAYASFAYEKKMPKLNSSNPEVRAYFMEVCRRWTRDYHIDGWRLDVANEVDRDFWREFRHVARSENPNCVFIAEIWESAESWLRGDMFDSTMNYDFRKNARDFFANNLLDAEQFDARNVQMRLRYPLGILQGQLNLLDSHDVSRFLTLCGGDKRRLRAAVVFQMTFPGVPSVFYGDELGVSGLREPEYRSAMPWQTGDDALREFYAEALCLRSRAELVDGAFRTLEAEPNSGLYVYERRLDNRSIIVTLNSREEVVELKTDVSDSKLILSQGYSAGTLSAFGYAVWARDR
ncbi:MAG: alpha amylase N-terminal ig-like domain-containing protein [Oscillospiraceae bacterium]|jgi:glycosidase|nr:alpha amylase N-terminal ig-like domain-containing protein [Oscillospiraceae bacterium]